MEFNKAKIITVTSMKGGTGKSTTVLNLAGIYSTMGKKVLIMDFDLFAPAISAMLNIDCNSDLFRMVDDINNNRFEHFEDYICKYNSNIDVLQGPKDPRYANKIIAKYLGIVIMKTTLKYDVVLIDTNHYMNEINLNTFDYSDIILYVMSNDSIDMKNMRTMTSIYKDMDINNYRVLLNSSVAKGRNRYSKYDIKAFIKHEVNYFISDSFYIKNIDDYIKKGTILTLDKKIRSNYQKVIKAYEYMANDLIMDKKDKEG